MRIVFTAFLIAALLSTLSVQTQAAPLAIRILAVTSPAKPGTDARVQIGTAPGADCRISVIYKSGPSRAKGLVPKKADSQGNITWVWRVGTRTTPGTWPIHIMCTWGRQQAEVKTQFEVK